MSEKGGTTEEITCLVERARHGDTRAFLALVDRQHCYLERFCRKLLRESAEAQDLVQETLLRAFQALGQLEEPARFDAWLLAIAANLARRWWRRRQRWPLSLERLLETYPDIPWPAAFAGDPQDLLEEAEQRRRLGAAIEALPADLQRVLLLHYWSGLSYGEIAGALDVPVTTVKGRLFKSRARLRRALGPTEAAYTGRGRSKPKKMQEEVAMVVTAPAGASEVPVAEVTIESIRMNDDRPSRWVVLREKQGERSLAIMVGVAEADAMAITLQGKQVPRPLSHDLMGSLLQAGRLRLERVTVTRIEGKTFYATLTVRRGAGSRGGTVEIDSRPSDAFALALRQGVPIYASESLLRAPDNAQAPACERPLSS